MEIEGFICYGSVSNHCGSSFMKCEIEAERWEIDYESDIHRFSGNVKIKTKFSCSMEVKQEEFEEAYKKSFDEIKNEPNPSPECEIDSDCLNINQECIEQKCICNEK